MSLLTILDKQQLHSFPATSHALAEPNGLLAIGGDLQTERLLAAYRRGIFPWPMQGSDLLWWTPSPRMVLLPSQLRIAKSLGKRIRRGDYQVSYNQHFAQVIQLCTNNRFREESWITNAIQQAYQQLHQQGHAHSIEISQQGQLIGGLYGLAIGGVFFGESMFSLRSDAAKLALYHLTIHLQDRGYQLIDCQVESAFLASLGAQSITRHSFEQQLEQLIDLERYFAPSPQPDASEPER